MVGVSDISFSFAKSHSYMASFLYLNRCNIFYFPWLFFLSLGLLDLIKKKKLKKGLRLFHYLVSPLFKTCLNFPYL